MFVISAGYVIIRILCYEITAVASRIVNMTWKVVKVVFHSSTYSRRQNQPLIQQFQYFVSQVQVSRAFDTQKQMTTDSN